MVRVCPHSDAICPNGMACAFSCATDHYDGTKRPTADKASAPADGLVERLRRMALSPFTTAAEAETLANAAARLADLEEARGLLERVNGALNAAFAQADAEFRDHDKIAARHEVVVRALRTETRAFLTRTEKRHG